jgi:hypothetical protein
MRVKLGINGYLLAFGCKLGEMGYFAHARHQEHHSCARDPVAFFPVIEITSPSASILATLLQGALPAWFPIVVKTPFSSSERTRSPGSKRISGQSGIHATASKFRCRNCQVDRSHRPTARPAPKQDGGYESKKQDVESPQTSGSAPCIPVPSPDLTAVEPILPRNLSLVFSRRSSFEPYWPKAFAMPASASGARML